jgi:hypothetical protein
MNIKLVLLMQYYTVQFLFQVIPQNKADQTDRVTVIGFEPKTVNPLVPAGTPDYISN